MAISKNQIFEAANQLIEAGQTPTLAAVRKVLGSGSFTTISEAMAEWKISRRDIPPMIREPTPTEIAERLNALGGELWQSALDLANARLAGERASLETIRAQLEGERQEAADLADQLATDLEAAQATIQRHVEQLAAKTGEIEQLRAELRAQTEVIITATHRADTLDAIRVEVQARVDQLSDLLKKEQAARQESEMDAYQVRQDVARLTAELAACERRTGEFEVRAIEAERAATEAHKATEFTRIAEQTAQAQLEATVREIERLREQLGYEREAARKAGESAAELRGRLAVIEAMAESTPDAINQTLPKESPPTAAHDEATRQAV
jgi:chromosome segregation ATPase